MVYIIYLWLLTFTDLLKKNNQPNLSISMKKDLNLKSSSLSVFSHQVSFPPLMIDLSVLSLALIFLFHFY